MESPEKHTKKVLTSFCKNHGLSGYSRFNKAELCQFLRLKFQAAVKIQRWYRYQILETVVNTTDFVTLETFESKEGLFRLRYYGKTFLFDSSNLLRFIFSSGKFVNPYTQAEIPDIDLLRLQRHYLENQSPENEPVFFMVHGNSFAFTSSIDILGIRHSVQLEVESVREREATISFLTEEAERIHEDMEDIMSSAIVSNSEMLATTTLRILSFHLPLLQESISQIFILCPQTAIDLVEYFCQSVENVGRLSDSHHVVAVFLVERLRRFQVRMNEEGEEEF